MKKTISISLVTFAVISLFAISCKKDTTAVANQESISGGTLTTETYADSTFTATDWTVSTHSNDADPNFSLIFDDTKVQRLDIVISKTRWERMLSDMTNKYGTFGVFSPGSAGGVSDQDEDPVFVPAEVFHNGKEWYRVGLRFKGNSSLESTWKSGNLKLSFKLDFDEFEDQYPILKNQRFYGFKKLSLKNNYDDKSFLREKVAGDVFRNAGLAASHTSFYTVYVDNGDGPVYFGLYTLTEEVDDTVISSQFSSKKGNLYKPDGDAASFASGSFDTDEMVKKTNEDDEDYTDVKSLLSTLHASNRTTDPSVWRTNLNAIFDTDIFLKYLAVNTTIQNWDTYGRMTHNYFLYNDPSTSLLTWIPWDNNEALQTGKQSGSYSLNFSGLNSSSWPLIGYLYNDAVYKAKYDGYLREVIDGPFNATSMQALYTKYSALVEPYATTEKKGYTFLNSSSDFYNAISTLKTHATSRNAAVVSYLK